MIFDQCFLLQFLCSYVIHPVAFHIVFCYSLCGFPHCILLQFLCSYVFYPVAFLMGVAEEDCFEVATLIGDKTFINEFYAYTRLSVYIKNRENLTWYCHVK